MGFINVSESLGIESIFRFQYASFFTPTSPSCLCHHSVQPPPAFAHPTTASYSVQPAPAVAHAVTASYAPAPAQAARPVASAPYLAAYQTHPAPPDYGYRQPDPTPQPTTTPQAYQLPVYTETVSPI